MRLVEKRIGQNVRDIRDWTHVKKMKNPSTEKIYL